MQDSLGSDPSGPYYRKYGKVLGTHSVWHDDIKLGAPIVYKIDLQVAEHRFTASMVQPIDSSGRPVRPPRGVPGPQKLPASTIYGFNGTFPGPRINAGYGQPALVHFSNHLDENPRNLDRQDFGSPNYSFLTHLHNGHTAPESDGQPHYSAWRFGPSSASRTRRPSSPASGSTRCTWATRRAATTARSSRSSGSTTTCTATPARTCTRAWSA